MCGIAGYVSEHPASESCEEMSLATLHHRGPDEQGAWQGEHVFLGMCRLSIIDLSGGKQPIWNEDRTCCIVYNGELYNFLDMRPELEARGHIFRTRSDTEVILHAYEEWGPDCLKRFNGMFAFAIWDERKKRLLLARDRIGEKPLYYYHDGTRLVFASEIKAILADPTILRQINVRGLSNYLAFGYAVAPETIYRNIYKLLPGNYLLTESGSVQFKIAQYWDVGDEPQLAKGAALSEAEYEDAILNLLDDSVRRRMIADVPVGAFLSGGVDSSAIVALMKRHASGPVKTFSLGFDFGNTYNELSDAQRVARFLGTDHYELRAEHIDLVETLRTLVYHYDEPFGDPAGFPVYLLSRFARKQVKVVLTGDGGDELFGGYRRYAIEQIAPLYHYLPRTITGNWIPAMTERIPRLRRANRMAQTLQIADPIRRYAGWLIHFSPEMQAELLDEKIVAELNCHDPLWRYPESYAALSDGPAADHINRLMYIDLKNLLVDGYLEKTDKATMACSLEGRVPFLDHRLVELAFQIPAKYKVKGMATKRILKQAVRRLVPPEVLQKPKHGFNVPTDPWFRGELKDYTFEILLDQRTRQRGYFNMPLIERMWHEHVEGRHRWNNQLWLLLNFELWHRIYLDGEVV